MVNAKRATQTPTSYVGEEMLFNLAVITKRLVNCEFERNVFIVSTSVKTVAECEVQEKWFFQCAL